jgi:transcriptional regulator with XRE-family HTH domain
LATAKAEKIRELREARGLSVDELSRRLGVDEGTVRRWESGEADVDNNVLPRLAESLGVSQDELRHEQDEEHHDRS